MMNFKVPRLIPAKFTMLITVCRTVRQRGRVRYGGLKMRMVAGEDGGCGCGESFMGLFGVCFCIRTVSYV